ncbi:MAG TPA: carboxypeptidase-like regulatory domain-containing protein, partial [Pyrinomonadaceae bacterium]|nr:carboxypeptidase-like regulatory domain-containing protein [Pyrinomonadaceae bacterium]
MKNFRFILAVLTVCFSISSAFAQSNSGSLVGTVVDQNGSAIAGATVEITDDATKKTRTVLASDEGTFTIPQLDVGQYTVKVTAQGFKTYSATELKIDVGKQYSLNVVLETGGLQESITVVAGADVINATNAELSNTVSPRQIQELPLNGRNPLALIALQAGTSANGATNTSINGQRTSFTNITRDGINIQDNFIRANATDFAPQRPGVDDISEFTLTSSNADASAGYGASQVQVATERGQSSFHGALFEYNRNSKFSSRPFFNNERAFLNRNQYGGKIGGPVPLPRF